jgi:hypothetical protein
MTLDSDSESSEIIPLSDLHADFSDHQLKPSSLPKIKLLNVEFE